MQPHTNANNPRESSCEGKEPFTSPTLAREVMRRMNRHGRRGAHHYRCRHCSSWHIAVNIAGKKRVVRRAVEGRPQ